MDKLYAAITDLSTQLKSCFSPAHIDEGKQNAPEQEKIRWYWYWVLDKQILDKQILTDKLKIWVQTPKKHFQYCVLISDGTFSRVLEYLIYS